MHSAPSVTYPVGRSRFAGRLVWGIWSLGAAGLAAWCVQFQGPGWRSAVLLAALAIAAMGAWRSTRMGKIAELTWDGQLWTYAHGAQAGGATAAVHLDLQTLMLVRLKAPDQGAVWVWVDRASLPSRWFDLRRALHATARSRTESTAMVPQP